MSSKNEEMGRIDVRKLNFPEFPDGSFLEFTLLEENQNTEEATMKIVIEFTPTEDEEETLP
jgi:hypothetical protein